MQIEWRILPQRLWHSDAALFFAFEKAETYPAGFGRFLKELCPWLEGSTALKEFKAKANETAVFYAPEDHPIRRVLLTGLGPADRFDAEQIRNAAAFALRKCCELGVRNPALPLTAFEGMDIGASFALREALVGALSGLYRFSELKTRNSEPAPDPESIVLFTEFEPGADLSGVPLLAESEAAGVALARDLTISPANLATPGFLVDTARKMSDRFGFRMETIDFESARSMGMGAFAAVAQGSREPAFINIIEHAPPGTENDPPLVFAGKGITFDTGGISLKARANLEAMKQDMAGAAAVLGCLEAIGRTGLKKRVIGIIPCTENMPGGQAYKPGDVVRSYSGQTIEVISTDAEGRMVLCDVLSYAVQRFNPAVIIDIATLTGACIVALGNQVAGVLGNREKLVQALQEVGQEVGERFWPLPLWDFYFEALKSDVADMKNVGDRTAGAIVAGIFLKQFIPQEVPWAHLDIAGTAWTDKDTGAAPRGATGFGVRTLFEIARRWPVL